MFHLPLAELLLLAGPSTYAAQHLLHKGDVSGLRFRALIKTQIQIWQFRVVSGSSTGVRTTINVRLVGESG